MNAQELKSQLTLEGVVEILVELGAEPRQSSNLNEMWCKTICHNGDSHKLYLFKDSLNFHCFTNCGSMDIIGVVQNAKGYSFHQAIDYICGQLGIYAGGFKFGFDDTVYSKDMELLDSFLEGNTVVKEDVWMPFKKIEDEILKGFYDFYHPNFLNDGISVEVQNKFEIKFDILLNRIIIPHRYVDGSLIAVRSRNLDKELVDMGLKYVPIRYNNKNLSAPTGQYFYGLYQNINNIILSKRVILVESEKAVLQYESMFPNCNIALALSSSNLSNFQLDILKELGVEEVIIALDKEYDTVGTEEEIRYRRKVEKSIINRLNFCTTSILWDTKGLLKKKDSPLDRGRDVFLDLFMNRIYC